jgi:redox-regulated HSP33 family molecular chaperone
MKNTVFIVFITFLSLVFLITGCDKSKDELILQIKNSGDIKVVFYAGEKNNPVVGAPITLYELNLFGPVVADQITDKNGEAFFQNIEQGKYMLYSPQLKLAEGPDVNQDSTYYFVKSTQVLSGETYMDTVNIKDHTGTIMLQVFDENDSLYTNANVYMLRYNTELYYSRYRHTLLKDKEGLNTYASDKMITGEDGFVTYEDVPTGSYFFGIVNKNDSTNISIGSDHRAVIFVKDAEAFNKIYVDF